MLKSENLCGYFSGEQVQLRAFQSSGKSQNAYFLGEKMVLGTFNMKSTVTTDAQKHLFYSHHKDLHIFVPLNIEVLDVSSSSPLYQNLDRLVIEIVSSSTSLRGSELDLSKKKLFVCFQFS